MSIAKVFTNSSGDVASAPATLSVTKPTGGTPGATDLLVLSVGSGRSGTPVGSYTAPSGWNSVGSLLNQGTGTSWVSGQVFWAAGSVSNLDFTKSGTVDTVGWVMVGFTGCDLNVPVDATGTANANTGSNSLTTNAVTVVTDRAWHLIGFFDWLGRTFSASGFTVAANTGTNESAAVLYNTTPKAIASTGTVAVSASGSGSGQVLVGVPFALRPCDPVEQRGRPDGHRGQGQTSQLLSF